MDLGGFLTELRTTDTYKYLGKIEKIVGMTIEASGPLCSIGDVCRIYTKDMKSHIPAEVVGFNEHKVLLMPYTDLEGIGSGSIVDNTGDKLNVRVGDKLIGRIIDALGNPLDDGEPIEYTDTVPCSDEGIKRGMISPRDIEAAICPETKAIVCTHASNLTGNVVDIKSIGQIARKHDLLFIVDASQTAKWICTVSFFLIWWMLRSA